MNRPVNPEQLFRELRNGPSIIDRFIAESEPFFPPAVNRWHNTAKERPDLGEQLSVPVVAMFRGKLVTGCYTRPLGYGYETFVFHHVLLRESIPDVTCWMYQSDLEADIQACMSR